MKFLSENDLASKGIPGRSVTLWRNRRARKLPLPTKLGRYNRWPEPLIDRYLEALAGGHSEQDATLIAENFLKALLARADEGPSDDRHS